MTSAIGTDTILGRAIGIPPLSARLSGAISILLWPGVIASGRPIVYL